MWCSRLAVISAIVPASWFTLAACAPEPEAAAAVVSVDNPLPHGDHVPRYGGVVFMHGDLHFEVVLSRSGRYRVYFSDATRAELPAAIASSVTFAAAGETVDARIDEAGESWVGDGRVVQDPDASLRVSFVTDGGPYWIDVTFAGLAP